MMMNLSKPVKPFFLLLFFAASAAAQQKNLFSAKQAVEYGLKNSIQVKNALIDVKIQQQTNREFTALAYPQVSGSMSANYFPAIPVQSIPDFISPAVYGVLVDKGVKDGNGQPIVQPQGDPQIFQAKFGTNYTASGGIEVSQILFDGQVFVGLKARSSAMELSKKTVEVTEEQIKSNIYKVYYQLVVGKKQMESIDANIELIEKLLKDTREIFKNGFAEKLDVDKTTVLLNNLKTEKIKIESSLESGNNALKFLMGMPQKDELVLTETLTEADLKKDALQDTAVVYDNRKEIQQLNIAQKLGQYNIDRYKLGKIPSIAAFGSYSKNAQRQQFDIFRGEWFTTSVVGVKISVPIFDGNARNARISKAKLELAKTKNTTEQLKELIDNEVKQAQLKMKTALLTIDNQKENMKLAEQVYNVTKKKYEQGLGSNQEIYTSQTELRVAQTNYYSSLYDAIIAKIDYLKAIGKL
jgi:outer membrane protein